MVVMVPYYRYYAWSNHHGILLQVLQCINTDQDIMILTTGTTVVQDIMVHNYSYYSSSRHHGALLQVDQVIMVSRRHNTFSDEFVLIRELLVNDLLNELVVAARSESHDGIRHFWINQPTVVERNVKKVKDNALGRVFKLRNAKSIYTLE